MGRRRKLNRQQVEKRLQAGWGSLRNHGRDYHPFYTIQDIASQGKRHAYRSDTVGRTHHAMSGLEANIITLLDWQADVVDIREQVVLDRVETDEISRQLGFRVPSGPLPLTIDFIVTIRRDYKDRLIAVSAKYVKELGKESVLRNMEVKRVYCERRNIRWRLVTEKDIPLQLLNNIRFVTQVFSLPNSGLTEMSYRQIASALTQAVLQGKTALWILADEIDQRLGLAPGQALKVAYHLIATRQWLIHMPEKLISHEILELLEVSADLLEGVAIDVHA